VSTIARNVDADNCIEGLHSGFNRGKTSYWTNKMLFHVKQNLFERGVFIRTLDWFERSLRIRMAQPFFSSRNKKGGSLAAF
jgi:hypothetical protein